MKAHDFEAFKPYFSLGENWGDISKVEWHHVHDLWLIRSTMAQNEFNWPMIIHCCYEKSEHSPKSYHYKGLATDFHFKTNANLSLQVGALKEALKKLSLYNFMGVGVYPDWHDPGFHLDSRGQLAVWIRDREGYHYYDELPDIS